MTRFIQFLIKLLYFSRWMLVIIAIAFVIITVLECCRHSYSCLFAARYRSYKKKRTQRKLSERESLIISLIYSLLRYLFIL